MKTFLKQCWSWLKASHRLIHLIVGTLLGLFASGFYCSIYAAVLFASALEFKDMAYGHGWNWSQFFMIVIGFMTGYGFKILIV